MFFVLEISCAINLITARIKSNVMDNMAMYIMLKIAVPEPEFIGNMVSNPIIFCDKKYIKLLVSSPN